MKAYLSGGDARVAKITQHTPVATLWCRGLARLRGSASNHRVCHRRPIAKAARGGRVLKIHHAIAAAMRRWRGQFALVVVVCLRRKYRR